MGLELRLAGGIQQLLAAAGSPSAAVLVDQAPGAAADVVQGLVVADGVADDGIPLGLSDLAGQGAIDQREQLGGLGAIAGGAGEQQQGGHAAEDQQADGEDEEEEGHGVTAERYQLQLNK